MKINFLQTSRDYQNLQHFCGGLHNIFLVSTGAFFGRGDWEIGVVLSILTFIVNRLSSEITYQTQSRLFKENNCK